MYIVSRYQLPFTLYPVYVSFRGGTRGNAVHIDKVFKKTLWTALRAIFRPQCTNLPHFAYTISKLIPECYLLSGRGDPWCLDPDTNFCLPRQRSHCLCFTKRSLIQCLRLTHCGLQMHADNIIPNVDYANVTFCHFDESENLSCPLWHTSLQ